jgi:hypothetical protein
MAAARPIVDLVLHAEALAFDDDGLGVMEDAVEDGGGQGAVVWSLPSPAAALQREPVAAAR